MRRHNLDQRHGRHSGWQPYHFEDRDRPRHAERKPAGRGRDRDEFDRGGRFDWRALVDDDQGDTSQEDRI